MSKTAFVAPAVKQLTKCIDGYLGYETRDWRLITDKCFRRHMVHQAHSLLTHVNNVTEKIPVDPPITQKIDKLKRGIVTVSEGLKYPTYLDALFFRQQAFNKESMNRLYECEQAMLHDTQVLQQEIDGTLSATSITEIENMIVNMQDFIDNFNLHQFERESLISE